MNLRLPPHDESAEKAVIGAVITEPMRCLADIQMQISPEHFYCIQCREAWETICGMSPDTVDMITVSQALFGNKAAAFTFLAECQDLAVSAANWPAWVAILQDHWTRRQVIALAGDALRDAYQEEIATEKLVSDLEKRAFKIRPFARTSCDIRTLVRDAVTMVENKYNSGGQITGLSTGLRDLDRLTDGLHKGEFVVLGAYPSCGKSALMVNIIHHNAENGIAGGILSAEMRPVQLTVRALCAASRANFRRLEETALARMVGEAKKLASAKLHIESANSMTIGQLTAMARRMKQEHDIQMLGVDYVQLIGGTGDTREREVASVSAGLKAIALELDIPVLAASQLNDDGKLRESRSLGQDGDSVWIVKNDGEHKPDIQPVTLRVDKCRDGETGTINLTFFKTFTKFENAAMEYPN